MNDSTHAQPQGADMNSPAQETRVTESSTTPPAPASAPVSETSNTHPQGEGRGDRRDRNAPRNNRPASAALGHAAGADALRALGRELRLARGEPADEPAESESAPQAAPAKRQFSRPARNGAPADGRQGQRGPRGGGRPPREARADKPEQASRPPRVLHPVIVQLAQMYPKLFGEQPLPLKRGIFQDLVAAHPEDLDQPGLKVALGLHTRSYRYLNAVAQGQPRHDLQGKEVEAMAPEHVHHALLEVFRRRKPRDGEDMGVKLRRRIAMAFEASGLTRESYDLLVRGRNVEANAALDDGLAEVAERDAKAEALRRTLEGSGQAAEAFAETYGLRPQAVQQALHRCEQIALRQTRELPEKPAPKVREAATESDPSAPAA